MNIDVEFEQRSPVRVIDALVARHGLVHVALVLAGLPFRKGRKTGQLQIEDLPDRLRRDIGLEPTPRSRRHWDVRL
ncbi:MAG: hypothetical protein R3E44_06200 [Paracoccaceae bacterium]